MPSFDPYFCRLRPNASTLAAIALLAAMIGTAGMIVAPASAADLELDTRFDELPAFSALSQAEYPPVEPLKAIEATGRVVVQPDQSLEETRRLAIAEALYFAALQGSAHVDGYSSVDRETSLTEEILVRPASDILDYKIVSEGQKDTHYEVTIEAIAGNPNQANCGSGIARNVKVFAPELTVGSGVPAWALNAAQQALLKIVSELRANEKVSVRTVMSQKLDVAAFEGAGIQMDYNSLVNGNEVKVGDFAIVPAIFLSLTKQRKLSLVDVNQVQMRLEFKIYEGGSYRQISSSILQQEIYTGVDSFIEPVNMLSRPDRGSVLNKLTENINMFVRDNVEVLSCEPLQGALRYERGRYLVDLGRRHGLNAGQLAILSAGAQPWTVLRIVSLETSKVYLEPINASKDLDGFTQQNVRFLEAR
jgi:hypothetical protein